MSPDIQTSIPHELISSYGELTAGHDAFRQLCADSLEYALPIVRDALASECRDVSETAAKEMVAQSVDVARFILSESSSVEKGAGSSSEQSYHDAAKMLSNIASSEINKCISPDEDEVDDFAKSYVSSTLSIWINYVKNLYDHEGSLYLDRNLLSLKSPPDHSAIMDCLTDNGNFYGISPAKTLNFLEAVGAKLFAGAHGYAISTGMAIVWNPVRSAYLVDESVVSTFEVSESRERVRSNRLLEFFNKLKLADWRTLSWRPTPIFAGGALFATAIISIAMIPVLLPSRLPPEQAIVLTSSTPNLQQKLGVFRRQLARSIDTSYTFAAVPTANADSEKNLVSECSPSYLKKIINYYSRSYRISIGKRTVLMHNILRKDNNNEKIVIETVTIDCFTGRKRESIRRIPLRIVNDKLNVPVESMKSITADIGRLYSVD